MDPERTSPLTPIPPTPPPPQKRSGLSAWRLLALGVLAFLVASLSGRLDLGGLVSGARTAVETAPLVGNATNDAATVAAIKNVIERANAAQVDAFARNDPTVMRATATDSYYDELVRINLSLRQSGVASIAVTSIEWGDITADASGARATSYETWRSTFSDGGTDERTDRNDYTLVRDGSGWRISDDVHPQSRVNDPGTSPSNADPGTPALSTSRSSNWSGYAASGGGFTSVTGSWTVPTVSATSAGSDATWVGIGGLTTNDLIQAGTQATVTGSGVVGYQAWIEMLPAASRPVPLSVTAGDSVTVTITQKSGSDWLIAMKNNTTGGAYNITVQYESTNSSAEWVQEAPSLGRSLVPLSQFGVVRFTAASAMRDGRTLSIADLGARAITMINGAGQALAQPSTLAGDGSSFTVTRTDAPSTTGGRRRRP